MPHTLTDTPALYTATPLTRVAVALHDPWIYPTLTADPSLIAWIVEPSWTEALADRFDVILVDETSLALIRAASDGGLQVIVFSRKGQMIETAYTAGCTMFLTEPINPSLVTASIRALMRRRAWSEATPQLPDVADYHDVHVDRRSLHARIGGRSVNLSDRQASVLTVLVAAAGNLVLNPILDSLFQDTDWPAQNRRYVIRKLRDRLRRVGFDGIENLYHHGYRLRVEAL